MNEVIEEVIEMLEVLLEEELAPKVRTIIEEVLSSLKALDEEPDSQEIIKIQDELETLTNSGQIDSFARNELFNVTSLLESLL
ncbi:MAG: UPF0147 family protein [Candidatus Woesearchaeota archaeon]|nr:UPF0147 family protein [Nanoarchaeota archaeon]USN44432.1 MAG: UPF0147 family protein [Candidatus Woesearchaeota archaeon]